MAQIRDEDLEQLVDLLRDMESDLESLMEIVIDSFTGQKTRAQRTRRNYRKALAIVQRIASSGAVGPSAAPHTTADSVGESDSVEKERQPEHFDSIAPFFEGVGRSMVAAQRQLDEQSRSYMRDAPKDVPPTVFRLPRASAEIRFAIEKVTETGFNIFIAKDTAQTRESMQHQVSFDIVAAPLPPDALARLSRKTVTLPFLGDPIGRESVRTLLVSLADKSKRAAERQQAGELAEPTRFAKVLIFVLDDEWLLVEASEDQEKLLLNVYGLATDGSQLTTSKGAARSGLKPLVGLLEKIAEAQSGEDSESENEA